MTYVNCTYDKQHERIFINCKPQFSIVFILRYLCEKFNNKPDMKLRAKISWPFLITVIILAGGALFASCEKYGYEVKTVDPEVPVLFQTEIQPIFSNNCIVCHKGSRDPDLRDGNSYASLTTGGYVNLPAETSGLYSQVISGSHASFTIETEKQLILNWIKQGAKNN